jgi:hypothetical protein
MRPKPSWSIWKKEASLRAYAEWLNELARASFLQDQGHVEMFFFVTEKGKLTGCQFRNGLDVAVKNATIQQEAARIKPYGTIHIKIVTTLQLPNLKMVKNEDEAAERRCLLVCMESRTGATIAFSSSIRESENELSLEETVFLKELG